MEQSLKSYLNFIGLFIFSLSFSQVNCDAIQDENCKKSCQISNYAEKFQWNEYAQTWFDEAIKLCATNDYAYREKAVPFLKAGDFITWKKLIDKAVEINPNHNLGYRAWCRYQFLRDYRGAIADFQELEKLRPNDLGYSQNGDYQLEIVKGICYSAIGQKEKAISIIENKLSDKNHSVGFYDYYQLGVTYFELNKFEKALENFEKQSKISDFAENIYFRAKVSKIRNKDYLDLKKMALKKYDGGQYMKDTYTHHYNKIYRKQIADL
ncbi:MAG: tetratricopeptide repeat protein [Cloacibacterium sp.]|nr:tetratricopeptide repeat protein [Cloacibacterium sp.]